MRRVILITGGNSGIGYEMAKALAAGGDRVIIASRDLARSQAAAETIRRAHADAEIEAMALDLGDLADVDRFAERLCQQYPVLDALLLNAGLYTHGTRALPNGLEAMIGVMHFGHFRLVAGLRKPLAAAEAARVVVTSSVAHRIGRIRFERFDRPNAHRLALSAYAQAKLANLLFTRELARRLADTSVTVNAFHPGAIATNIWGELPAPIRILCDRVMTNSRQGADTGVWLARDPAARAYNGQYFVNRKPATMSRAARSDALAERLWQETERRLAGLAPY